MVAVPRERRAGREAEAVQDVRLPQPAGGGLRLLQADAYLSGFDTWYTRDHSDHELMRLNFDALAVQVYQLERMVQLRLRFQLTDEDTNDDDDFNEAWLGLVVVAHSAN